MMHLQLLSVMILFTITWSLTILLHTLVIFYLNEKRTASQFSAISIKEKMVWGR